MPQLPPRHLVDFARGVLRHEARPVDHDDTAPAFEQVCRALHERLARLFGAVAVDALLGRSVKLAALGHPLLTGVTLVSSGGGQLSAMPVPDGASERQGRRRVRGDPCALHPSPHHLHRQAGVLDGARDLARPADGERD
jgi:hypothetical protein